MRCLKWIWREGKLAFATLAVWWGLHGAAVAQVGKDGQGGPPKPVGGGGGGNSAAYTLPYFLVALAIGLGIYVLCRPSHRRERARPEEYTGLGDVATGK
jgi:hypothetical protein